MSRFYPYALFLLLVTGALMAQEAKQEANRPTAASTNKAANSTTTLNSTDDSLIDENPVTVKTSSDSQGKKPDNDPLFGVPPLPKGKTSLIGGTVANIDGVHDRLGVKIFGKGGKWTVAFDERTHFFVDGTETTFEKVKKGERVYVDTMLDGHQIFARNVHIVTKSGPASARGQVEDRDNDEITLNDDMSAKPVRFHVDGETQVKRNRGSASLDDIQPGSLISVQFAPGSRGNGVAKEITILAAPGQSVQFAGTVRHLDMRNNFVAVENRSDSKTYEITFNDEKEIPSDLTVGSEVTVEAVFDGRQYRANSIRVQKEAASNQ